MRLNIVIITTALLLWAVNAHSQIDYLRAADGVSYTHGHVKRTDGELVKDPNSDTGHSWVNSKFTTVEETNQIPLNKGHGFGVHLYLFKLPAETNSIEVTMTHPPMELPSGEVLKIQSGAIPIKNSRGFPEASFSYSLDEDYEMVAGDWVITFAHQGDELFHITFTTYQQKTL